MKVIRFTRNHGAYNGGELAGFEDERAAELIEQGKAIEVKDPDAVDEVKPAPTVVEEIPMMPRDASRNRKGRK
jgi:hypothetical protein